MYTIFVICMCVLLKVSGGAVTLLLRKYRLAFNFKMSELEQWRLVKSLKITYLNFEKGDEEQFGASHEWLTDITV